MQFASDIRYDGPNAAGEEAEQILYEVARKERHITRCDENVPVPRGQKTGFDAGERSLTARP
jgi:hypothetical protein